MACQIPFCRFLQTLAVFKSLHGPRLRRRPCPQNARCRFFAAFFRKFPHFLPTFCRSKIHQKSDPSKTHPKSQKSDPMAPKARFWSHFCTLFSPLFAAFSQNFNFLQTCIFPRQGTIFKVLAPHFFIKNPFKNHVFSSCLPGPHFSAFYVDFLRKGMILGPPLGSAGAQNGGQNHPGDAKIPQFLGRCSVFFAVLKTTCFQDRSWSAPGLQFGRSWVEF